MAVNRHLSALSQVSAKVGWMLVRNPLYCLMMFQNCDSIHVSIHSTCYALIDCHDMMDGIICKQYRLYFQCAKAGGVVSPTKENRRKRSKSVTESIKV